MDLAYLNISVGSLIAVVRQFACRSLVERAVGYGIPGNEVDGTDLAACLRVVGEAIARARAGEGPQLVVAHLLRLCGHGEHDDSNYIDQRLKSSALGGDCLKRAEDFLRQQGWADVGTLARWRSEFVHQVEDAVATAQREPTPDPFTETWSALATAHLAEGNE